MQTTANYGLKKPDGTDVVNVQDFNDNADTIDTELKKRVLSNGIGTKNSSDLPSTWPVGLYWSEVYNNGFPCAYGNCLTIKASRTSVTQLCIEWTGADATSGKAWIRNKRDTGADAWSPWREFSFSGHTHSKSDITDFPSSMTANGGNSTTVNNHTANGTPSTTEKTDIIKMINEVFQSGTNVKSGAISAVNSKGGNLSASATWDQIIAAISAIARGQGDAVESQVLSGVTFSNKDGQLRTGNMPNRPAQANAVSVGSSSTNKYFRIPTGAYLTKASQGYPEIIATASQIDSNIVAENIKKNVSICGVAGSIDLSNLKSENVKKDVNINGTIGTLEERFSTFDYMKNLNASYVLLNVLPEGAYCQNPSVQRSCYLINQSGSVLKTITNSDATYYPFLVTSDKIFWQKASYYIVVSDKNGTTLQTVQLTYQPMGGVKLENNQYIIIDSSGYIYLFDENFNQIRKWTSGAYELLGIFTKGTDCFFIMQTSNSIIRSYYLDTTSNNGPFLVGYNNGNKNVLQYLN
ncbi:hypothetical protein [Clostridium tyrobutyricum]|uniref:hypothetical protein n=1 Tax=Clostridium tyrobutyricum TaxID=1519 RepID=UPI0003139BAB|nr:hypothetical protein [Clostridium tyrobutyricum]